MKSFYMSFSHHRAPLITCKLSFPYPLRNAGTHKKQSQSKLTQFSYFCNKNTVAASPITVVTHSKKRQDHGANKLGTREEYELVRLRQNQKVIKPFSIPEADVRPRWNHF